MDAQGILFTLFALLLIHQSHEQIDRATAEDINFSSLSRIFGPLTQIEVSDDTKPVLTLKNDTEEAKVKFYHQFVKPGSLAFNKITFFGAFEGGSFLRHNDHIHREYSERGGWLETKAFRSIGRIAFRLTQFDATVTWASPSGPNRTCEIIGLSKCGDNSINGVSNFNMNLLRIFYDNAIILRPWPEVIQNTFKEHGALKTLQWKTYMQTCPGVSPEERRNVTAGIDQLFLNDRLHAALVKDLSRRYREEVLQKVRDKIDPKKSG